MPARYVKVTLSRAENVNALSGYKARTLVTAKASFKNLVYTTSRVEDMGQNPVWEKDGTSEFHFEVGDSSEFITLELFNRANSLIGLSKLYFSQIERLPPGNPETKTLPVMASPNKQFGELILEVETLEDQAMGEWGLLMVELRRGQLKKIISFFGARTAKIKAKLTYKHTTFTSGVLENMGNRFIWHKDNVFTFMINSDVKPELDALRIEIYNVNTKVGEGKMLMSLLVTENNLRGVSSEFVAHTTDLSHSNKSGVVGNIEVGAGFIPAPVSVSHERTPYVCVPGVQIGYPTTVHHTLYPFKFVQDPLYEPSVPVMNVPVHLQPALGGPAAPPPAYPPPADSAANNSAGGAVGAPAGSSFLHDSVDEELKNYFNSFH